ncbi:MAG TPA: rod shape-determining protein MreC [Flexilinea sp.]|jgi:rod shape-determining protein MreC|nr:rod shape-determining protein MreC [Flexilinea sp.]HOW06350.1 rod shape-determining protein MreC [Flexilinea sp.]HPS46917.1 rod shape-determining protein MreC [Flexilinea sp.]HQF80397.1 rod shape-determining protein MreC [Flexilinea sp.]HQG88207.1 rod shape-determining protein MreC [Flexilinea sp.]
MNNVKKNWQKIVAILIISGVIFLALSGFLTQSLSGLIDPIIQVQKWTAERIQTVYEFFTIPRDVTQLRAENQALQEQVSLLQTEIIQLQQDLKEADILYSLLGFARGRPEETYIAAAVIGVDPSPFLQYILIDKGSDDGIAYNMPVVTEKGLVGRISAVTASAARVQLITDAGSLVNAHVVEADADGVVRGSVTADLTIEMVSPEAELQAGQIVQTSGLGGNFPAEVVIGQILNVNKLENELFQSASIQPAEDFSNLQAVLVVANFRPSNVEPLE